MEETYKFADDEKYHGDLNPYVLGILKWNREELQPPQNLKYFQNPNSSNYPMKLNSDNYHFRYTHEKLSKGIKIHDFLKRECIQEAMGARTLNKMKIFTSRGVLARLIMGPNWNFPWKIYASKIGNNMCMFEEKDDVRGDGGASMQHWMFVQNLFADSANGKINVDETFYEDDRNYVLLHSQIGDYDLIYTGEMTGVDSHQDLQNMLDPSELNNLNYVLTKTVHAKLPPRKWEDKYKQWWAQAYLANVKDIYVGIKVRSGIGKYEVREKVRHFKVDNLCKNGKWNKEQFLGRLYKFLNVLETKMADIDCAYTTLEINFNPLSKVVNLKKHDGKTKFSLLSEEFINYLLKN